MKSNKDLFDSVVEPGGLLSPGDVKLLVCYLLKSIGEPVDKEIVINSIIGHGLANYYSVCDAIAGLVMLENTLESEGGKKLAVTKKGEASAELLEIGLPVVVREKVVSAALEILSKNKIVKENAITIDKLDNGCRVSCKVSDGVTELFSMSLFVPDMMHAEHAKQVMLTRMQEIYLANLELMQ